MIAENPKNHRDKGINALNEDIQTISVSPLIIFAYFSFHMTSGIKIFTNLILQLHQCHQLLKITHQEAKCMEIMFKAKGISHLSNPGHILQPFLTICQLVPFLTTGQAIPEYEWEMAEIYTENIVTERSMNMLTAQSDGLDTERSI